MFENYTHFHLDPQFFPESTRKAFPTALMIKLGALPLGFKTETFFFRKSKTLNIGLLNPENTEPKPLVQAARQALGESVFSNYKIFKIEPEGFIKVLEMHYGVKRESLNAIELENTHPTLRHYIELERNLL